jgi:CheY-like chemotaxis protein
MADRSLGDPGQTDLLKLLAFNRKQILQPKVLDVNALIGGMEPMLRQLIVEHIDLTVSLTAQAALIMMDPTQLEAVRRIPPDVILLDVNMPLFDGFEVCRRLKQDVATRLIPVVLLTALSAVEDRVRGIDAGADDFLTKPFVISELKARVRSLTRLKRYTDELDSAEAVILSLAPTIEARDPYTRGHCDRLARYATALSFLEKPFSPAGLCEAVALLLFGRLTKPQS